MRICLPGALAIVLSGAIAHAAVLFNNFGDNDSTFCCGGRSVGDPGGPPTGTYESAASFVSPGDFFLSTIVLPIRFVNPETGPNRFWVYFRSDANGVPGEVVEMFEVVDEISFFNPPPKPIVIDSLLKPLLISGAVYWISVDAARETKAAWWGSLSDRSDGRNFASRLDNRPWEFIFGDRTAFRVNGVPQSEVPEPAFTMVTFFTLISGLMLRHHRNGLRLGGIELRRER
jgi:hypothetical protein